MRSSDVGPRARVSWSALASLRARAIGRMPEWCERQKCSIGSCACGSAAGSTLYSVPPNEPEPEPALKRNQPIVRVLHHANGNRQAPKQKAVPLWNITLTPPKHKSLSSRNPRPAGNQRHYLYTPTSHRTERKVVTVPGLHDDATCLPSVLHRWGAREAR